MQSLLLALAVFSGYLQRVNLAVTIVAITNIKLNDTTAEDENVANVPVSMLISSHTTLNI